MIKNYFNLNRGLNIKKAICLLFVFFIFIQISHGQCATPVLGCSNTDLSNFGTASNNNAATIEYDNFVSSWHSTAVRTSDGSFQVWGEYLANGGASNLFVPSTVNSTNFPILTGTPLKIGLGSNSQFNVQGIVLATDGLYAWATRGIVLDNSLTTGPAFQKVTIGGNTTGLPVGVAPADVKMMFVTSKTIAITTCSGDVWVISQNINVRGNGATATSATTWYRVKTSDSGNPFLTDVVACRGSVDGLMALRSDGSVYVWGSNVLLGNNTAIIANQSTAVKMILPTTVAPKMIGSTGTSTLRSYYILTIDGNLYGLGENSSKELGDWTTTDRLSWVQPKYGSASGTVMNDIKWMSPQEHDSNYGAMNVINNNKKLFSFGNNNNSLLGRGTTTNTCDPGTPGGITSTDEIIAVETGGHTSMLVKSCETKFGYVGHRTNGSMGNGAINTATEANYTFATANVQICGAESNPAIQPISTGGGPNSKYCVDDPVLLNPTPTGGTLSILSGPGTLSGNTLSFTGVGTVSVQYSVTTACGGTSVTTRNFDAALCPVDLQVTKVVDNTNASVGSNSVFTITATNNGPYKATGVVINDALPSGYTFVSAVPSAGTWTAPDWTIGNLANAASATLTVTATVNPTGSYANTATISGNNPETGTTNNSATATPIIQTNLSVTKSVDKTTPNVGDTVKFTITASNSGPSAATGVVVTDSLPSGYTFVSATPSAGTWLAPDWTVGSLANGVSETLIITATVNATGSYINTATITGVQNDPTPVNNSGSVTPVVNHAPVANDDDRTAFPLTEDGADGSVAILVNDTDSDGNPTAPVNGANQFTVDLDPLTAGIQTTFSDAKGSWTLNTTTGIVTFNPANNYNGTAKITYTLCDALGLCDSADITFLVNAVNDNPVAVDDTYTVAEDTSVTLNPLHSDTDLDGDTLTITSINGIALTGGVQEIAVPNGKVNISATGVITFIADANFNSATAIQFPYEISDGKGGTATANQIIAVTAVNDNPVAVDDSYTVSEDNSVILNPLHSDTDVDGDILTITSINGTTLTGGVQEITVPNGKVNISATGVITFIADANFNSATAIQFPYEISDGKGGTATANQIITVTAVNDNPVAVDDSYTVSEDSSVILNPLHSDTDVDGDTLTITSINGTTLIGGVQEITVPNGKVNISATGVITFIADANFNSATAIQFPYEISDGKGGTTTANQVITVTAVNDNPAAVDDSYTVSEDSSVILNPLNSDTDVDGETLTITSINGITLIGGVQEITVPNGKVNISATGVITFIADANFNTATAIQFPYEISDGKGGTATANQIITVTAVNDNPVAVDDSYTVTEDSSLTLNPLHLDTDVDGDILTITSINGIVLTGGVQEITVPNGKVNISATGVITFTPDANFNSVTAIQFLYEISDGKGGTATANQIITVTAVNDNPVAVDDTYTVSEDTSVTLNPLHSDTDVDGDGDTLTITSINGITLTGGVQEITVPNGKVNISATGVITFTPDANFNSATAIQFPYQISDGNGGTATANQIIMVTAVNDDPVAVDDSYTVAEDNAVTLNPLNLDTDVDGDTLTITSINGITLTGGVQEITVPNGKVNISATGVITFTPDANFNSATAIQFPYEISDGKGGTATANQVITVTLVNDAPIANADSNNSISSNAGETPINALSATDIDGTITNYTIITLPTGGILKVNGTIVTAGQVLTPSEAAQLTYEPNGAFTGNDTFTFTATDNLGAVSTSAVITIPVVNNAPVANDQTNSVIPSKAGATVIDALTASDSDGTIVNYIVLTLPANGILALNGIPVVANKVLTPAEAAILTYDPSGAFAGNDTFTFTATDNNGSIDATPAIVTIPVVKSQLNAVKDEAGSVVGINEVVKVINILNNDTLDNNPIVVTDVTIKTVTPDPKGILTLNPDGTADLAPNAPAGTYTLTYEICEAANNSNCSSATVSVTVVAPEITVTATSFCSDNAAYVTYNVAADNFTPKGLVTINWIDSANNIVATQTNMPINGTVLWPGTILNANNKPTDWPGWVLVNGQWTEGNDGFELTRPAVTMQFSLNPTKSVSVNYPSALSGCSARPQFGIEAGNDNDNVIADGINGSLEVVNVLDNDKLNGVPVNPADVTIKGQNFPTGITLNADGTIDVAPGTPGGNYDLTYQICEKANASNCTTATVHIFVEVPAISLIMKASLNDTNGNGTAEAGETITYTFTVKNTGNTALQNITIADLLPGVVINGGPVNLAVGERDTMTFTGKYVLTQADIIVGLVSNQATVSGFTQKGVSTSDISDAENIDGDTPTVIELKDGCSIKIFNAVSLNGDEKNTRFYIRGIECYPDNTVQVYNRWGVLVFERDHYNNNDIVFKGFSEGRTTVKESNGLPEGTYYYILRYKDNQSKPQQEAGYLYLTR